MKTVGLVMIVISFCAFGWYKSREYKRRCAVRRVFCEWLSALIIVLNKKDITLGDFILFASRDEGFAELDFLSPCLEQLDTTRSLSGSLVSSFENSNCAAMFSAGERSQIISLFGEISGYDEDAVALRANSVQTAVSARLSAELADEASKSRLCLTLYSLLGFAIAVLLM